MMNNNKILTVSYGTFSCTLEGFDDSFDTMKAIAEYFRDLAADDRYFGAEPPQPDAEMLARIAEKEVSRRVEAREHDGRIMLKAHDDAAEASAQPAPVAAPQVAAPSVADVAEAAHPKAEAPPESQAFDAPYTDTPEPPSAETAFQGIEGQVATDRTATPPQMSDEGAGAPATVIVDADVSAQMEEASAALDEAEANTLLRTMQNAEEAPQVAQSPVTETDDSVAAFFADSTVEDASDPEAEETISVEAFTDYISPAAAEEPQPELTQDALAPQDDIPTLEAEDVDAPVLARESFAEKLARIRAVVAKQDEEDSSASYEDENADPDAPQSFTNDEDAQAYTPADVSEDPLDQQVVSDAAQDIEEALQLDDAVSQNESDTEAEEDAIDSVEEALKRFDAQDGATETENQVEEPEEENASDHEEGENLFGGDYDDDQSDVLGRVMKVNRADLEATIAAGDLEEYEDDSLANVQALSDEEEQDLQRELAELESDEDESESDVDVQDASLPQTSSLPSIDEDAGEDISRLMAEADEQMAEPEGRTRRSAFAHLRAAVAARFADRSMESEQETAEKQAEAYRSDLAEVVKPRRPSGGDLISARPAMSPNAPLKLVAEQRVYSNFVTEPNIAPRRVAASLVEENEEMEENGFADYAEAQGATTLPELLEAAASYLRYVEGQDQFSRPQLMSRVRQADCGEFSREDGLRSFGQLLRTGKIEKVKGGRFAASEAIGYKPDHRAAG